MKQTKDIIRAFLTSFILLFMALHLMGQSQDRKDLIGAYIPGFDIQFKCDFVDKVFVHTWDKDSIRAEAHLDLKDKEGNSLNKKFRWKYTKTKGIHSFEAEIRNQTAHYVVPKSRGDYQPKGYKSDKVLYVGTVLHIYIPSGVNLEFEADMGDFEIDYPGKDLLVSGIGKVEMKLSNNTDARLELHSMFGDVIWEGKEKQEREEGSLTIRAKAQKYQLKNGKYFISIRTQNDILIKDQ